MNDSRFLQSTLTKKKALAQTALPKSVSITLKASLLFHGFARTNECIADGRLPTKDAVDVELSHRTCGAGRDQGLEVSIKMHWAGQSPNWILSLHSVKKKNEDVPGSKVTGRRIFTSFAAGVL